MPDGDARAGSSSAPGSFEQDKTSGLSPIMRITSVLSMLGIVAGFSIVLAWFVMPDLGRHWLMTGGLLLTVFGCTGLIATRRHRYGH